MKQKQKQEINLVLMKKLQDANKTLKDSQVELSSENIELTRKFAAMKSLIM